MKQYISLLATAAFLILGASCSKLVSALLQTFTFNAPVPVSIPMTLTLGGTDTVWFPVLSLNADSIIRAQTQDAFSLDKIQDIHIEGMKLQLSNADVDNNIQNFEYSNLLMQTNNSGTWQNPQSMAENAIPDTYADNLTVNMASAVSLKTSLQSKQLRFGYVLKNRRLTTKVLEGELQVTFRVK